MHRYYYDNQLRTSKDKLTNFIGELPIFGGWLRYTWLLFYWISVEIILLICQDPKEAKKRYLYHKYLMNLFQNLHKYVLI